MINEPSSGDSLPYSASGQGGQHINPLDILVALAPEFAIQTQTGVGCSLSSLSTATIPLSPQAIDLVAIFRAFQTLSSLLQTDAFLQAFTQQVLQFSGGDRCAVVLPEETGSWQVQAVATAAGLERPQEALEESPSVPIKLIQYVRQHQDGVLISALNTDLPVLDDYLHQHRPQSCLCLPIRHQGTVGVVYISHQSYQDCFSHSRILALSVLASQAAIALENIHRYALEQRQGSALQLAESRFKAIFEKATDAILLLGDAGFLDCNQATVDLFGYTDKFQLCSIHPAQISPDTQPDGQPSIDKANACIQRALQQGSHQFEWVHQRWNGDVFWAEVTLTAIPHENSSILHCVVRDISDRKVAEQALRESEAKYQQILDAIADMVLVKQENSRIVWANRAFRDYYGMSNAALQNLLDAPFNNPDYTQQYLRDDATVFKSGQSLEVEEPITRHDGAVRQFNTIKSPIRNEAGEVILTVGVSRDITGRREAEVLLRQKDAQYRQVFETITDGLGIINLDTGELVEVNPAYHRMHGYAYEAFMAVPLATHVHPDSLPLLEQFVEEIRAGHPASCQARNLHQAGHPIDIEVKGIPYRYNGVTHALAIVRDVSDRKAAEESLKHSEEKFRTLVSNINGAVYRCQNDHNWTMHFISGAITDISGYDVADFIQNQVRTYASIIHPEDTEYVNTFIAAALAAQEPFTLEYRLCHRDGTIRWVYEKGKGIFDETGELLFLEGVFFDVSDVKFAEDEKIAYQEKLEFLIQKTTLGVIEWDTEFKILAWNPAAEKIFGYRSDEAIECHARLIVPTEIQPQINEMMNALITEQGGNHSINKNITKDGKIITCEWINTVLYDSQHSVLGIYSIVQDITARTQAETALKQSESTLRYQAMMLAELSQSPAISQGQVALAFREITERTAQTLQVNRVSIWLFDPAKTVLHCQDLFERNSQQHSRGHELQVMDYPIYFAAIQRERNFAIDHACTDSRTAEFAATYFAPLEITSVLDSILGSDGRMSGVLWLESTGEPRHWQAAEENFVHSVANLVTLAIEASQRQQQAQELAQTLEKLQRTQLQLVQSEKMSSVGQLVAGVAHEINNPISFIHGNLVHADRYVTDLMELLDRYRQHYPLPHPEIVSAIEAVDLEFVQDDLRKLLKSMHVGTERIQRIVKSLRTFSRLDEAEVKNVNLHEGIDSTLLILRTRLRAQSWRPEIRVIRNYGNLPRLKCYAGQLNQVFMNLLSNAIDALEERDQTRTLEQMEQVPSKIQICTQLNAETDPPGIEILVADNGPGMSQAICDRLFTPFFTTKPVGKGTGLGLSISYQVITERHDGSITCHSVPGQGTTFKITLPLQQ